jgi:hypothetical protein
MGVFTSCFQSCYNEETEAYQGGLKVPVKTSFQSNLYEYLHKITESSYEDGSITFWKIEIHRLCGETNLCSMCSDFEHDSPFGKKKTKVETTDVLFKKIEKIAKKKPTEMRKLRSQVNTKGLEIPIYTTHQEKTYTFLHDLEMKFSDEEGTLQIFYKEIQRLCSILNVCPECALFSEKIPKSMNTLNLKLKQKLSKLWKIRQNSILLDLGC